VARKVAVTTPPSRPPRSWNGEGEVLGVVPLLRAEDGEEESQVGLVAPATLWVLFVGIKYAVSKCNARLR